MHDAIHAELLRLEESFWLQGTDFYSNHLAPDALMAFSDPIGILTRNQVLDSIAGDQRWSAISMTEAHFVHPSPDSAVLMYRAIAHSSDGAEYRAIAASVYGRQNQQWKLAFHQQTPL